MGQTAQSRRPSQAVFSIDWMVLAVAIFALTLLLLTVPRGGDTQAATTGLGGLDVLAEGDRLVAFQDFSFDADGWSPDVTEENLAGLGPVLGRFMDERVARQITTPEGTAALDIRFDLHLAGAWTPEGAIVIALGDAEVIRIPWSDAEAANEAISALNTVDLAVRQFVIEPAGSGSALPGATPRLASYAVSLTLRQPAQDVTLSFEPAMPVNTVGASWAIDNFSVFARGAD